MKKTLLFVLLLVSLILCFNTKSSAQVDLYLNEINVYINSYGRIQIYTLPDTIKQIERLSVLVASASDAVFDYNNDQDIEEETILVDNPQFGDYEIYGAYNNNYSGLPPNVLLKQNVYCWNDKNFIIVKYTIINRESSSIDAIPGLDFIPQVEDSFSGGDTVTYSDSDKIISVKKSESVGIKALSEDFDNLNVFVWYDGYSEDTTYYRHLTNDAVEDFFITDPNDPNVDDPVIISSLQPRSIASGDSITFYFAVSYGADVAAMKAGLDEAVTLYNTITDVDDFVNGVPSSYRLNQNYPNPFNPGTVISFNLPRNEFVSLKIYNTLGQEVGELVNGELPAGQHSFNFNAGNLSSGLYFYEISAGNFHQTKKMLLLK